MLWKRNWTPTQKTVQILCMFERKYYEECMAQYKIKDAGLIDGIVKFIICTKI
jgi:hypothetical protein